MLPIPFLFLSHSFFFVVYVMVFIRCYLFPLSTQAYPGVGEVVAFVLVEERLASLFDVIYNYNPQSCCLKDVSCDCDLSVTVAFLIYSSSRAPHVLYSFTLAFPNTLMPCYEASQHCPHVTEVINQLPVLSSFFHQNTTSFNPGLKSRSNTRKHHVIR